jgi:hypothetical protein
MTRQPHDQFAKEYLQELLTPLGQVEISKDVSSEVREIDLWFEPNPNNNPDRVELGLLGQIAKTKCLFEPYRNPVNPFQIRSCQLKLYSVEGDLKRQSNRQKNSLKESELPFLWILTPTCSTRIIEGFGATPNPQVFPESGVYFLPPLQRTAIIVIHQLPVNDDTLWLRVLGRGNTQKQAVEELVELPETNLFRSNLLEILANWRKNLELRDNLSKEQQETIMNLSPAYLQQREEWKLEGKLEGKTEGIQEMVELWLTMRFGNLDSQLSAIIPQIVSLETSERNQLLLSLSNLSREELLARFNL